MKIDEGTEALIGSVLQSDSTVFSVLVELSGLKPEIEFETANLAGVDFRGSKLNEYNLNFADLRSSLWDEDFGGLSSFRFSLRGRGRDIISADDFDSYVKMIRESKTWTERFYCFAILVDNFGETWLIFDLLTEILDRDKSKYMCVCSYIYLAASYCRMEDSLKFCRDMANARNSKTNIFKFNKARRLAKELSSYLEKYIVKERVPGELSSGKLASLYSRLDL